MADTKPKPHGDGNNKYRQESETIKPSEKLRRDPPTRTSGQVDPKLISDRKPLTKEGKTAIKKEKSAARENRQIGKSKLRAERSGENLDKARSKLAAQKPNKPQGMGKGLSKAASAEVSMQAHRKIREVERENVGVEAAHSAELNAERGGRLAVRHVKQRIRSSPARRVKKMEKLNVKSNANLRFRQMAKENPALKKNALKRFMHKKRIQKQFQKQASKAAQKAMVKMALKIKAIIIKLFKPLLLLLKNPKVLLAILVALLLVIIVQACVSLTMSVFSGLGGGVIGATTYLAEDDDIYAAQAAYAQMEADLQYMLDNYAALNPGYDEYRFNLDEIWHDPYVLISILSAFHDGAWTFADVEGRLATLFGLQYILTETVTVEVRTRTVTGSGTDPDTGEDYEYEYEEEYDYYIITVTLVNFNLSHLPIHIMGEATLSRYALYMGTLGNRPDLFPVSLFPRASYYREPGRHDIPQEYLDADPVFAAMMAEAEKFIGFPYIWGGYNPNTSFDCSGFVSWVINNSGWNVGRLGASGLFNICTTVPATSARPGDLVFFVGTYAAPDPSAPTHVGIYVGDGMMIHAGNPIGYVSINTTYWQSHFHAFGRLP